MQKSLAQATRNTGSTSEGCWWSRLHICKGKQSQIQHNPGLRFRDVVWSLSMCCTGLCVLCNLVRTFATFTLASSWGSEGHVRVAKKHDARCEAPKDNIIWREVNVVTLAHACMQWNLVQMFAFITLSSHYTLGKCIIYLFVLLCFFYLWQVQFWKSSDYFSPLFGSLFELFWHFFSKKSKKVYFCTFLCFFLDFYF